MNVYVINFLCIGFLLTVVLRTVVWQESFRRKVAHRYQTIESWSQYTELHNSLTSNKRAGPNTLSPQLPDIQSKMKSLSQMRPQTITS